MSNVRTSVLFYAFDRCVTESQMIANCCLPLLYVRNTISRAVPLNVMPAGLRLQIGATTAPKRQYTFRPRRQSSRYVVPEWFANRMLDTFGKRRRNV
jgi:hypothetical protein